MFHSCPTPTEQTIFDKKCKQISHEGLWMKPKKIHFEGAMKSLAEQMKLIYTKNLLIEWSSIVDWWNKWPFFDVSTQNQIHQYKVNILTFHVTKQKNGSCHFLCREMHTAQWVKKGIHCNDSQVKKYDWIVLWGMNVEYLAHYMYSTWVIVEQVGPSVFNSLSEWHFGNRLMLQRERRHR